MPVGRTMSRRGIRPAPVSGGIVPAVANFLQASFTVSTDTAITAYTPEIGGAFTNILNTSTVLGATDQATGDAPAASALVINNATPPSPNYSVKATCSRTTGSNQGVLGRAIDVNNYYRFHYDGTNLVLIRNAGGGGVSLGSVAFTWASGDSHTLELRMNGTTIAGYVDGATTPVISVTDSSLTAPGKAGYSCRANAFVDDLIAY